MQVDVCWDYEPEVIPPADAELDGWAAARDGDGGGGETDSAADPAEQRDVESKRGGVDAGDVDAETGEADVWADKSMFYRAEELAEEDKRAAAEVEAELAVLAEEAEQAEAEVARLGGSKVETKQAEKLRAEDTAAETAGPQEQRVEDTAAAAVTVESKTEDAVAEGIPISDEIAKIRAEDELAEVRAGVEADKRAAEKLLADETKRLKAEAKARAAAARIREDRSLLRLVDGKSRPEAAALLEVAGQLIIPQGVESALYGPPQDGKSWIAAMCVLQARRAGGIAIVRDFEAEDFDWDERLRWLGASDDDIAGVVYDCPDEKFEGELGKMSDAVLAELLKSADNPAANLVVLDSMTSMGGGSNEVEKADEWYKQHVGKWRTISRKYELPAPAVLAIGHQAKSKPEDGARMTILGSVAFEAKFRFAVRMEKRRLLLMKDSRDVAGLQGAQDSVLAELCLTKNNALLKAAAQIEDDKQKAAVARRAELSRDIADARRFECDRGIFVLVRDLAGLDDRTRRKDAKEMEELGLVVTVADDEKFYVLRKMREAGWKIMGNPGVIKILGDAEKQSC